MATWRDFVVTDGNDGKPVDAASLDEVRNDIIVLMDESPMCIPAHEICNGPPTVPRTGSDAATVDFAHVESLIARFNFFYLRSGRAREVRLLRVAMWAYTSGNTGTLRATWGPNYHVPADPPELPDIYIDSAAGDATTTAKWIKLEIPISIAHCRHTTMGRAPLADGGGALLYPVGHLTLQGRMLAAGTLTVSRLAGREVG